MLSLRFLPIAMEPKTTKPKHITQTNRTKSFITFSPTSLPKNHRKLLLATPTDTVAGGRVGDSLTAEGGQLPAELRPELMPRHVAVIMDGNVRWARQKGLPSSSGYEALFESLREIVKLCSKWDISVLTVFVFSLQNWTRAEVETDFLMGLIETVLRLNLEKIARDEVRISMIGETSKLPKTLQKLISEAEKATRDNSGLHLIVAISYSGQNDIVKACKSIACQVKDGLIQMEDINETLIEHELETNCTEFPYPDLVIRTSGEVRISNFLLWQVAYSEMYFTQTLWPDFGEQEFVEALSSFQKRQRRYGQRNLQVAKVQ